MATSQELKQSIDARITNKTNPKTIAPKDVGESVKDVVDYVDQQDQALNTQIAQVAGMIGVKVKKVVLTSAQILTLGTVPISLLTNNNTGTYKFPLAFYYKREAGLPYTIPQGPLAIYTNVSGLTSKAVDIDAQPLGTADREDFAQGSLIMNHQSTGLPFGAFGVNEYLLTTAFMNNPSGGDGGMTFYLAYVEIPL